MTLARFVFWLLRNADAAIALVVALVVAVIGLSEDPEPGKVASATLLVLGLLAASILRDRYRRAPVEDEIRGSLRALETLPARLERLDDFDRLVRRTMHSFDESSAVRAIGGDEVGPVLAEARRGTDRWIFKGGTGTYIRAVTLPRCVEDAKRERRALLFRLEIIDPSDEEVCDAYARFRRAGAPVGGGQEPWTLERTRKESYATVLAACYHRGRYRLLDIDIGLSRTMTTFRWDLSSSCVVITREDPTAPALRVDKGKFYYDWCYTELLSSLDQARRVPIEQARSAGLSDEPTVEEIRRLFQVLDLPLPRSFSDRDVADIARRALRAVDPYGDPPGEPRTG